MEYLPSELNVKICENLSIGDLGRLRTTSWTQYNICRQTLINRIIEDILRIGTYRYMFISDNSRVELIVTSNLVDVYKVIISIKQFNGNWLFPYINHKSITKNTYMFESSKTLVPADVVHISDIISVDKKQMSEIVTILFDNDYIYSL